MTNKITPLQAIRQNCWQCLGYYADGKTDCENIHCPLYSFMPYANFEPDLEIFLYNPKKCGKIKIQEKEELTEEEKKKFLERFKK